MSRARLRSHGVAAILLACGAARASAADTSPYYIQVLTQSEGLSESNVTAVQQDRLGFIWFGTQDGLDRYDGYSLRTFRHATNDPDSLSDNFITTLYLDAAGALWVGTRNGLERYQAGSETFTRFLNSQSNPTGIGHIAGAGPGRLWLTTDHGLLGFDIATGQTRRLGLTRDDAQQPVLQDHGGTVWLGTEHGLMQIDAAHGTLTPFLPVAFGDAKITALHEARDGALWVGTSSGAVFSIAPGRGLIQHFPDLRGLIKSTITRFADTPDGSIWIGTQGGGLITRQVDGDWIQLPSRQNDPHALPSNSVTDLFADSSGSLWIGLSSPGVAHLNPLAARFQWAGSVQHPKKMLGTEDVRSVLIDAKDQTWIGTGNGIQVFSTADERIHSYRLRSRQLPVGGTSVITLFRDHLDRIWVGVRDGGLCVYLPQGDRFKCYVHVPGDPTSLSDDNVLAMAEYPDGVLWLGTFNGGLDRFDPSTSKFHAFTQDPKDPHGLSSNKILSLVFDPAGYLWAGTYGGGLNRFDPKTGRSVRYSADADPAHRISGNNIASLSAQAPGEVWVGTSSGLDHIDATAGNVRSWTTDQGLPSNLIFSMVPDTLGNLWLGTNNGLVEFEPARGVVAIFSTYDGLWANEFSFNAAARSPGGTLFMGTVGGMAVFNPVELESNKPPVHMVLTGLSSYGIPVRPDPSDPKALLQQSIAQIRELRLPYSRPEITLDFAALGAVNPDRERYAYRLVGLDDRWSYLEPGRHSVSYSAPPAGDYQFEVQPVSEPGAKVAAPLRLRVIVPPPPWLSAWAYAGYALVLTMLLAWATLHQRRRLVLERRQAQLTYENEARLQLALWASGEGTWDARRPERMMYCPELMLSLGYKDLPQPISGPAFLQLWHPDDRGPQYERYERQAQTESGVIDVEFRIRHVAGHYVWWKMRGKVVERDAQGNMTRAIGMAKNISEDKEKQAQLQLAALFMENSTDSIAILDRDYRIIKVNRAFEKMTGYPENEVLGRLPAFLSAARDSEARMSDIKELIHIEGKWSGDGWIRRRSGENFLGHTQVDAVYEGQGNVSHFVAITADITRQRLYEDELRHLANHDMLTGLPNRTLLNDRLAQAIVTAQSESGNLGMVLLSLDNFSRINDSLGHDVGDEVLRETARRLLKALAPGDTVSRVGGDTFALLVASSENPAAIEILVKQILETLSKPVAFGSHVLYPSASAGISLFPDDGGDPVTLIKNAETALFKTKVRDKGAHTWYASSMGNEAKDYLDMQVALHRAIEQGELSVHYQPKLQTASGAISGVEALVRWRDKESNWVLPSEFIPVAEMYGLMDRLGEWVLRTACREIACLQADTGIADIRLAVNLSPKQLQIPDLVDRIMGILGEEGFPPERLQLELTESVLMYNPAECVRILESLRARGITLAVDDFGTGYSSLGYLKRFPITEIKVDKSFVDDMDNRFTLAIIKAIVALGLSLGMEITAEGVETESQMLVLGDLGCTQLQGFHIAKPMDYRALCGFLSGQKPAS